MANRKCWSISKQLINDLGWRMNDSSRNMLLNNNSHNAKNQSNCSETNHITSLINNNNNYQQQQQLKVKVQQSHQQQQHPPTVATRQTQHSCGHNCQHPPLPLSLTNPAKVSTLAKQSLLSLSAASTATSNHHPQHHHHTHHQQQQQQHLSHPQQHLLHPQQLQQQAHNSTACIVGGATDFSIEAIMARGGNASSREPSERSLSE